MSTSGLRALIAAQQAAAESIAESTIDTIKTVQECMDRMSRNCKPCATCGQGRFDCSCD